MKSGDKIIIGIVVIVVVWAVAAFLAAESIIPSFAGLGPGADDSASGSGVVGDVVAQIAAAITAAENVNPLHNNPGGICAGYDASGNCTGPASFDTLAEGQAKLEGLIQKYLNTNPAITVQQFVQKWTGGATSGYLQTILTALHLNPGDPIASAGTGSGGAGGDDGDDDGAGGDDDVDDGGEDDGIN